MNIDIVKELKKDFPHFVDIFFANKNARKLANELASLTGNSIPQNIPAYIKSKIRSKGIPHFAGNIFYTLFGERGTVGLIVNKSELTELEKNLYGLRKKHCKKKVIEALTGLLAGSDRFPMKAHAFHIYSFGSRYRCEFERSFPKGHNNPSFDIYVKKLNLAIEVRASQALHNQRNSDVKISCIECAFEEAVKHTLDKKGGFTGKMLCAFSLPWEYFHLFEGRLLEMIKNQEINRDLYYLFHDPGSLSGSKVVFLQFKENIDLFTDVKKAFKNNLGGFISFNEEVNSVY